MSDAVITVDNVGLRYRRRIGLFRHDYYQALKLVSFNVYDGETLGVIGRNGCGKSTLLKLLASILLPDSGQITFNKPYVSLLSLSVGFDPQLSGRDNIIISAMLLGASRNRAYRSVAQVIEFSELAEFIDQPVKSYSSGMRMRLGFSIAITIRPDVLLIDEVLGAGDAYFRVKAEEALSSRFASDQTVVIVSHNGSRLKSLCDRVLWLENGRVKMQGKPDQVINEYHDSILPAPQSENLRPWRTAQDHQQSS